MYSLPTPINFKDFQNEILSVKLEGTEKQIAWAEKIRAKAFPTLLAHAGQRTADGRPTDIGNFLDSEEKMLYRVNSFAGTGNDEATEERKEKIYFLINDAVRRINVVKEIMLNTSAKFWIDNRPETIGNSNYKKFYAMIDGK